jgi:hypothetical protein
MTVVFATATAITALRPARDYYLFLLGALAFLLATAGRDYRRRPIAGSATPRTSSPLGSYIVLLTTFYVDNVKNLPLWDRLPIPALGLVGALVDLGDPGFALPGQCRAWSGQLGGAGNPLSDTGTATRTAQVTALLTSGPHPRRPARSTPGPWRVHGRSVRGQ